MVKRFFCTSLFEMRTEPLQIEIFQLRFFLWGKKYNGSPRVHVCPISEIFLGWPEDYFHPQSRCLFQKYVLQDWTDIVDFRSLAQLTMLKFQSRETAEELSSEKKMFQTFCIPQQILTAASLPRTWEAKKYALFVTKGNPVFARV